MSISVGKSLCASMFILAGFLENQCLFVFKFFIFLCCVSYSLSGRTFLSVLATAYYVCLYFCGCRKVDKFTIVALSVIVGIYSLPPSGVN